MKNFILFLNGIVAFLFLTACGPTRTINTATPIFGATVTDTATTISTNIPAEDCSGGYIALTFDDGPFAGQTDLLLAALEAAHLRAAFFDLGGHIAGNEALVLAQWKNGWVGNHSWSHADLSQASDEQIRAELRDTQKALQSITGETPALFRPPYLKSSGALKASEADLNLSEVMTNIDSKDWAGVSTEEIAAKVSAAYDGAVILMHDNLATTRAAIPQIAGFMREKKLCSGRIDPLTGRAVAP